MELSGGLKVDGGEKWTAPSDASSLYGPNKPHHVVDAERSANSESAKEFPYLSGQKPRVLSSI